MIKEDYVSFEVAKLLKEKGFNESCNRVYEGPNLKYTTIPISPLMTLGELKMELGGFHPKQLYVTNNELGDIVYAAPTHQMAMAWLREKGILLWVEPVLCLNAEGNHIFQWMWDGKKQRPEAPHFGDKRSYNTYEEAVEESLKYCLENLI